jgi:hypothetical protein
LAKVDTFFQLAAFITDFNGIIFAASEVLAALVLWDENFVVSIPAIFNVFKTHFETVALEACLDGLTVMSNN